MVGAARSLELELEGLGMIWPGPPARSLARSRWNSDFASLTSTPIPASHSLDFGGAGMGVLVREAKSEFPVTSISKSFCRFARKRYTKILPRLTSRRIVRSDGALNHPRLNSRRIVRSDGALYHSTRSRSVSGRTVVKRADKMIPPVVYKDNALVLRTRKSTSSVRFLCIFHQHNQ